MGSLVAELAEKLSSATNNFDIDEGTIYVNTSADTVAIGGTSPDGKFSIHQSASADILNLYDGTTAVFTVLDGGNVGIGTTAPGNLLNIVGTADNAVVTALQLENTDYAATETGQGVMINFRLSQAGTAQQDAAQIIVGKDSAWHDDAARDAHIAFKTTEDATMAERMRIQHDGKIGIGTTSPLTQLNVAGADPVISIGTGAVKSHYTSSYDLGVLQIGNSFIYGRNTSDASNFLHLGQNSYFGTDGNYKFALADEATLYTQSGGNHIFYGAASGTADATITYTESMRFTSDGKIGIGGTPAYYKVEVMKTDAGPNSDGIAIKTFSTTATDTSVLNLIKSNNNTINTQTETTSGHVLGEINFYGIDTTSSQESGSQIIAQQTGAAGSAALHSDLRFRTSDGTSPRQERMIIDSSGKIGIGTTAPGSLLHVYGTQSNNLVKIQASSNATNDLMGISFHGTGSYPEKARIVAKTLNTGNNNAELQFYVGGFPSTTDVSQAMTIINSGNVGIASTAPTQKLDVTGTAKATKMVGRGEQESSSGYQSDTFCVEGVNTTNASTQHGAVFASKHSSSYNLICGAHDSTFNNFRVRADGRIFANNLGAETSHTGLAVRSSDGMIVRDTSSRRYKSNIVDTTIDSTLISNIQVRDFTWTETGNDCVGLIAEEVNEHIPKAVVKATENGETVCEAISWPTLTSLLIDYSQKLEERIAQLESAG